MAFLTTAELADIRTHLAATLPDTCEIQYVTETRDSIGGSAKEWTSRGTAIACRLGPLRGRFGMLAEQIREGQFWTLHLAYDQTIEVTDKVLINSTAYQVLQVNDDESEKFLKKALLESEL